MEQKKNAYNFNVVKNSGEKVPFDPEKIHRSLQNVNVSEQVAEIVIRAVELEAHEGISTRAIYRKTFELLRKYSRGASVRYRLKEALSQLGTTGYPFEQYVGDLFAEKGYHVQVGVAIQGRAIRHEVDVLADNDSRVFTIECKYHCNPSAKSDVKVPMYILSRYTDIRNRWEEEGRYKGKVHQQWVATNTRFTDDAIAFAKGYGIQLLGWDYPRGASLRDWVQLYGAYPITCLASLSRADKHLLVTKGLVSCRTLYANLQALDRLPFPQSKKNAVRRELEALYANSSFENKK